MISKDDYRAADEQLTEIRNALDEMRDLQRTAQNSGVTVDAAAYDDAQTRLKEAVAAAWEQLDTMVDESGTYQPPGEDAPVDLPQQALGRKKDTTNPPEKPGGS